VGINIAKTDYLNDNTLRKPQHYGKTKWKQKEKN
jgi:hypothetical protein